MTLKLNGDTSPAGIQRQLRQLAAAVNALSPATQSTTGSVSSTALTDNMPRWVSYPVSFSSFVGASTSVTIPLATLPAGTVWTSVWIEPGTQFVSPSCPAGAWRLGVDVPATGATVGGAPKTVDMTTPDSLGAQAASWHVQCNRSGSVAVTATIDSGGTDDGSDLTAGSAVIHLLLSVPNATTDQLPHA